jgi:hypothetical protein
MKQAVHINKRAEPKAQIAMTVMTNHRAMTSSSDDGAMKCEGGLANAGPLASNPT